MSGNTAFRWFEDVRIGERFVLGEQHAADTANKIQLLAGSVGAPFAAMALIGLSSRFVHETRPRDRLFPVLQVVALEPYDDRGLVILRCTIHNQDRELLMEGEQHYLLQRRSIEEEVPDRVRDDEQGRCGPHARH